MSDINIGANVGHYPELPYLDKNMDVLTVYPVIRFMEWQRTNHVANVSPPPPNTFDDLPKETIYEPGPWINFHGVALDDIIRVANTTNSRAWLCVPHTFDEQNIKLFVEYVISKTNNKPIFEFSNELWNQAFLQSKWYAETTGKHEWDATQRWIIESTKMIKKYSSDRADVVLSGQARNIETIKWMLNNSDVVDHIDAIATAPYFGQGVQYINYQSLQLSLDVAITDTDRYVELANEWNRPLWAYEGGTHITKNATVSVNWLPVSMLWQYINRVASQFDMHMMYNHAGVINQNTGYGLYSIVDGEATPNPRFDTIKRLLPRWHDKQDFNEFSKGLHSELDKKLESVWNDIIQGWEN